MLPTQPFTAAWVWNGDFVLPIIPRCHDHSHASVMTAQSLCAGKRPSGGQQQITMRFLETDAQIVRRLSAEFAVCSSGHSVLQEAGNGYTCSANSASRRVTVPNTVAQDIPPLCSRIALSHACRAKCADGDDVARALSEEQLDCQWDEDAAERVAREATHLRDLVGEEDQRSTATFPPQCQEALTMRRRSK